MGIEKNLSCVSYGIKDLRLEERDMPVPERNQLLIRVHTVGICGTDIHLWTDGALGRFIANGPFVQGHESSGTEVDFGADVKGFQEGKRLLPPSKHDF